MFSPQPGMNAETWTSTQTGVGGGIDEPRRCLAMTPFQSESSVQTLWTSMIAGIGVTALEAFALCVDSPGRTAVGMALAVLLLRAAAPSTRVGCPL